MTEKKEKSQIIKSAFSSISFHDFHKRLRIPTPPKSAPIHPRIIAGQMPVGSDGRSPLNGTYVAVDEAEVPPVPPPVKLAPFGCYGGGREGKVIRYGK
jgi:hypothetical protein